MTQTRDPRRYQIATLGALAVYGFVSSDFHLRLDIAVVVIGTALVVQLAATRVIGLPRFDPKSALISALSLCLLLRTESIVLGAAAAAIAILSKFALRIDGRHVFNPTNFAIVVLLLATGDVWVSPGQWGTGAVFVFLLACVGGLVTYGASRSDVTLGFIASYAGLVLLRSAWLGEPAAIPFHHLQSGALVLFAFFMISDPKTTPDSRTGRLVFAATVAVGAAGVQFVWFQPNGLLWSLVACAPLTPVLNRLLPGSRYEWRLEPPVVDLSTTERKYA